MSEIVSFSYYIDTGTKGQMILDLDELPALPIRNLKKLVGLIQKSENPEVLNKMAEYYMLEWSDQTYKERQKILANTYVNAKGMIESIREGMIGCREGRNKYKKNSALYKQRSEHLTKMKFDLAHYKRLTKESKTEFEQNKKIKKKIDVILNCISQE